MIDPHVLGRHDSWEGVRAVVGSVDGEMRVFFQVLDQQVPDVVVILDCLEHIPDPRGLMQKVAAWTQPDATLFIRGPLVNSAVARSLSPWRHNQRARLSRAVAARRPSSPTWRS